MTPNTDPAAIRILKATFWDSTGWRKTRTTALADLKLAKDAGVMFDAVPTTHDELIPELISLVKNTNRRVVADAFLASLTNQRLDLRSAFGSYAVHRKLALHDFTLAPGTRCPCIVCGAFDSDLTDLNVLNFERHKWGGVRHNRPEYARFDLEWFGWQPKAVPTAADIECFKEILGALSSLPPKTSASKAEKALGNLLPSNKDERVKILEMLGYCGILVVPGHPGFHPRFIPYEKRERPPQDTDMHYPANWWKANHGIDAKAVAFWFGHRLKE